MTATALAAELTTRYRGALTDQASRLAAVLLLACRNVNPADLDASMARAAPFAARAIIGSQDQATRLSYAYLWHFIGAELGTPPENLDIPPVPDLGTLVGSTVKGQTIAYAVGYQPIYTKRLIGLGVDPSDAVAKALANLQATGQSETYRAAHESLRIYAQASGYVEKYRRVTGGNACEFCSMLAGRGAVYRLETSTFRSHRNCHCTAEPVVIGTT